MNDDAICLRFQRQLERGTSLQEATYLTLRAAILQHESGQTLTEGQLSELLGVSRTPIRAAMLRLEGDGLLEIAHGRPAKVIPLTKQDIGDIADVLSSLHSLAVVRCIQRAGQEELQKLEELIDLICFYTQREQPQKITEYNAKFHLAIAQASQNKWLADSVSRFLTFTSIYREHAVSRPGRSTQACEEHRAIFQAILRRDEQVALSLVQAHVSTALPP